MGTKVFSRHVPRVEMLMHRHAWKTADPNVLIVRGRDGTKYEMMLTESGQIMHKGKPCAGTQKFGESFICFHKIVAARSFEESGLWPK
jgi:hypothetical protein